MIVNIIHNSNNDAYLASALLFFNIDRDEHTINTININTLKLETAKHTDPIVDPTEVPDGDIYYFVGTIFTPPIMGNIIQKASEVYYIDNDPDRIASSGSYSFTDFDVDVDLSISHLASHFLKISVDENIYAVTLVGDYFKHEEPNENSINFQYGLKCYHTDLLKSRIGKLSRLDTIFLTPPFNIWDCLLNSKHCTTHLQKVLYAGRHIRDYLSLNLKNNALQSVEYLNYALLNTRYRAQIIYGNLTTFDDYDKFVDLSIHDALICYNFDDNLKVYNIYIKFFKAVDDALLKKLYNAEYLENDIYYYTVCDINSILPTECKDDLESKSYTKTINFQDPNYPNSYTVLFTQCSDYIFNYAYSLLFDQDTHNFFGIYKYNFITDLYEVRIKSEYEQDALYNFEVEYNAWISEDRTELILYMTEQQFSSTILP